jgi:photosystem II stability/assembly factor-like uncharacterized protein
MKTAKNLAKAGRRGAAALLMGVLVAALPAAAEEFGGGGGVVGADVTKFPKELKNYPAMHLAHPEHAQMVAAARAGARTVAVGDHGTILLSDDDGKTWRQAKDVPTRVMMNSVCFVDDKQGWAAGHWGEIIATSDGGETWKLQRTDTAVDQPFFSIYFSDASHGLVVGLWSLALQTADGGATWTPIKMPALSSGDKAGPNLYQIVPARGGTLYIAAEQGLVYKSKDGGQNWEIIKTGNKGSFWTGLVMPDDSVLMAGLNGKILRSTDAGKTWKEVDSGIRASITSFALTPDGGVAGAGLEGATLSSKDGTSFEAASRPDRAPLTAVVIGSKGNVELFSKDGVIQAQ